MQDLETVSIQCPFCGEAQELVIDCSVTDQHYVEDCQVCCRPMNVHAVVEPDGQPAVTVRRDDD